MARHYEKVIAACCFLLMFCNVGLPSTSFSVYQPYIVALPGVGDSAGSIIIGVRTFVSLICMILVGRYYSVLDCRIGCAIASFLTAAGMLLFGFSETFPMLCLSGAVCGAGYGLGGMIGITLLVNRWFRTDVGTAIGVAAVGSGVASIVIPLAAERVIRTFSLSISFWAEAALAAAIGVLVLVLLRNRPEDMGLEPYVHPAVRLKAQTEEEDGKASTPLDTGVSLPVSVRRLFLVAMAFVGAICVAAAAFLSVLLVSEGYSHAFSALMLSVSGLFLTLSKFLTGRIFDKIGAVKGTILSFTLLTIGLLLLCFAAVHPLCAVAGVTLYGLGMAIGSVGIPIWSLHLSTPAERGRTVRQFQVGYATGSFLFNLVPGVLMDLMGSYVISYALMTGMSLAAMLIIVGIYGKYHDKQAFGLHRKQGETSCSTV